MKREGAGVWLGAGVGFRRRYRRPLLHRGPGPGCEVLEIIPEHFHGDPDALDALAEQFPLVFHGVGLSMGTPLEGPGGAALAERVDAMARLARRSAPRLVSDHLATTVSAPGRDLGHLGPVPLTETGLSVVSDRVKHLQDRVQAPVALEITAQPFVLPGSTLSEGEFAHRLVEQTGCGLLMDLTNVLYNSRNFGYDAEAHLHSFPLHAVWQVHLAGGFQSADGWWVDSHTVEVADESYDLLKVLARRAPLMTIIIERDDHYPTVDVLIDEAARAEGLWLQLHADEDAEARP
ncbi:MAG: DUF692 family multinuclear iron-containing protein [Bradymonadia bacterium]